VQHVAAADTVYFVATALGVLGAIGWLVRPSRDGRAERAAAGVWLAAAGGSVLLLALLSTRYDFGRCFFPSRGFPYFAAGRLLSGAMTPAAIVVVGGFGELLAAAAKRWPRAVLIGPSLAIAMVCLASEVYLCAVPSGKSVAGSPGNFFHVVGRK
jgi:hypothetical protein